MMHAYTKCNSQHDRPGRHDQTIANYRHVLYLSNDQNFDFADQYISISFELTTLNCGDNLDVVNASSPTEKRNQRKYNGLNAWEMNGYGDNFKNLTFNLLD